MERGPTHDQRSIPNSPLGSVEYASIDAPLLLKILDSFRADALAQYVIGFEPGSNASPKGHNLEVRVAKKSSGSVEGGKRRAVY
jgi:hypothetical protein